MKTISPEQLLSILDIANTKQVDDTILTKEQAYKISEILNIHESIADIHYEVLKNNCSLSLYLTINHALEFPRKDMYLNIENKNITEYVNDICEYIKIETLNKEKKQFEMFKQPNFNCGEFNNEFLNNNH